MIEILCENCKASFLGRPNRRTCSVKCRRTLEVKRRFWDRKFRYVHFCEVQANWETLTAEQRKKWQEKADETREKLLGVYGNRP